MKKSLSLLALLLLLPLAACEEPEGAAPPETPAQTIETPVQPEAPTPEPIPEPEPESEPGPEPEPTTLVDRFPAMSKSEHTALHTLFSNFSEVGFNRYDATHSDISHVVDFALWHNYTNSPGLFALTDDYLERIASDSIDRTLYRFFHITGTDHNAYATGDSHYYRDGYYYLSPAGGTAMVWSQVTAFLDNGDGTYTAHYDVYVGHYPPTNLYDDIEDWRFWQGDPEDHEYNHSCVAVVKPHEYNGKQTYYLLTLERAEGT